MLKQCPACERLGLEIISRPKEFEIRGEKIVVEVKTLYCPNCGNEFDDSKEFEDPFRLAYDEYRRKHSLLLPDEIIGFRKQYDLTQKELSNLLGFGEVTLTRYENGALQDSAHDKILKLAMDPNNLLELLKNNPSVIDSEKRERISEKIRKRRSLSMASNLLTIDSPLNEYTGFTKFNLEKLAETIKLLCFNRNVYKTKLMKLLFYSDFIYFKEHRKSITGLRYAHLPLGPVPDQHELILWLVSDFDSAISFVPVDFEKYSGEEVVIKGIPTADHLSEDEKDSIFEVSEHFEYYTSKDLSILSHLEPAYKKTRIGEMISYNFAKNLNSWSD